MKAATPPQFVSAFVGKHNLSIVDELGSAEHSIWEIILHHDWSYKSSKFDADISLVVLTLPVDLSGYIEPICLPNSNFLDFTRPGVIVGWGLNEFSEEPSSTPIELELPAVSDDECFASVPDLQPSASNRTFCGGFFNQGKSACSGKSSQSPLNQNIKFCLQVTVAPDFMFVTCQRGFLTSKESCRHHFLTLLEDATQTTTRSSQMLANTSIG